VPTAAAVVKRVRERAPGATRAAILAAAEELLARGGDGGFSVRELCARTGVTPPTIYHHFGDKGSLVDRIVDQCFADFDRSMDRRRRPSDPVELTRWGFDRYVEFARRFPTHYRLMFQRPGARPTPGGLTSYGRLRAVVVAADQAGRLAAPVEDATAALWAGMHGVASLVMVGALKGGGVAAQLVRDSLIAHLTRPAPKRRRRRPDGA
jgi:AcrR family transcriptional regulator